VLLCFVVTRQSLVLHSVARDRKDTSRARVVASSGWQSFMCYLRLHSAHCTLSRRAPLSKAELSTQRVEVFLRQATLTRFMRVPLDLRAVATACPTPIASAKLDCLKHSCFHKLTGTSRTDSMTYSSSKRRTLVVCMRLLTCACSPTPAT
jgi:hypothetical protein